MNATNYTFDVNKFPLSKMSVNNNDLHKLSKINVQEIIIEKYYKQKFNTELKIILESIVKKNKVYLTYIENFESHKSKVRSFRKMFYTYREKIGKKNLFETEIDTTENQSILTSIIKLDRKNIDFCLEELINSNLAFGFIIPKKSRSFKKNRTHFLNQLIKNRLEDEKTLKINFLKLLSQNVNLKKYIFTIHRTESKEYLRFFSQKDENDHQNNFINNVEIYVPN
jgi:hypothetical protein